MITCYPSENEWRLILTLLRASNLEGGNVLRLKQKAEQALGPRKFVTVHAADYTYEGWLTCEFQKHSGAVRCIVEDDKGRLFIHNMNAIKFS